MTVRLATHDDIEMLVAMCREFHDASPFRTLTFSPSSTRMSLKMAIQDPNSVVFTDGHGLIAGSIRPNSFTVELCAYEIAWFTTKPSSGIKMLAAYEEWVKQQGVQLSFVSMMSNDMVDSEKLADFMIRRGYSVTERTAMMRYE